MLKTNLPNFYKIIFIRLSGSQVLLQAGLHFLGSYSPFGLVEDFCAWLTFSTGIYLFVYLLEIEPQALHRAGK